MGGQPAVLIPLGQVFQVNAQLLALLIEMASLQPQRLRGLRNLAAMPVEFGQYLGALEDNARLSHNRAAAGRAGPAGSSRP